MKHVLYFLLICICVASSVANGKYYAVEGASVEVAEGEGTDSDDKDPPRFDTLEDFLFSFSSDFGIHGPGVSTQFTYLSDSDSSVELEYFCPPPNSFRSV